MSDQRCSDSDQSKRDIPSFIEPRPPLILNPFMRPRPQKGINLLELFAEDSESEEPEWLQVYLRLKPYNGKSNLYDVKSDRCLITSVDTVPMGHGRRTQHNVSKMYTFSHIFGPESSQKEIFEHVVKDNLKKLPDGHNFTLLSYGASGSGKTFTLMGTVQAPGLVPRSLEYVFRVVDAAQQPIYKPVDGGADRLDYNDQDYELQFVKKLRHVSAPLRDKYRRMSVQLRNDLTASTLDLANRTRYYVWVSFVEIYNESIYDLLTNCDRSKATSKLRIREDSNGNVYVKGATQVFVRTGEEAYDVLVAGKHNLQVAATGVHANSSRSHCIFTITMLTETDEGVRSSCVRLCDLAGCERARNTRNTGARMQESRAINSSLHVLERCLHMLRRKQKKVDATLVPYRESKLTRLLGAGLSGARGEAVSMVVTLNPAPHYAHETRHVLQLAAVAKDIQVNQTIAESTLESSTQLTDTTIESSAEIMKLRVENERLHFELIQSQTRTKELLEAMEEKQQEVAKTMFEIVEEAKDMTRQYYEFQLQALRAEMEEMQEEYESKLKEATAASGFPRLSTDVGSPSRALHRKVTELMTAIAILEEKLTAEKLARARAEEEVQHLRACIDERDEKGDDSGHNEEVSALTNSESEEEYEDDPCNESLEPTFKKEEINRSRLHQQSLINDSKLDYQDDTITRNHTEADASVIDKHDTTKEIILDETIKDSTYVSNKSDQSITREVSTDRQIDDIIKIDDKPDDSIKANETVDTVKNSSIRGTYFVRDGDKELDTDKSVLQDEYKSLIVNKTKESMQCSEYFNIPEAHSNRFTSKLFSQSNKSSNENDMSLAQFELLELASTSKYSIAEPHNVSKMHFFKDKPSLLDDKKDDLMTKKIEHKTYFDNLDVNLDSNKKNSVTQMKHLSDDRSPSIVKEDVTNNFEPSTMKLLGESFTRQPDVLSATNVVFPKKCASLDIFEGFESPNLIKTDSKKHTEKPKILEDPEKKSNKQSIVTTKKDIPEITPVLTVTGKVINYQTNVNTTNPIKSESTSDKSFANSNARANSSIFEECIEKGRKETIEIIQSTRKSIEKIVKSQQELTETFIKQEVQSPRKGENAGVNEEMETNVNSKNNIVDEFDNLCKDVTGARATEFELLLSQNGIANEYIADTENHKYNSYHNIYDNKNDVTKEEPEKEDIIESTRKYIDKLVLSQQESISITKPTIKQERLHEVPKVVDKSATIQDIGSNVTFQNNTVEEFDNIYKDISAPRATEFELLVSQNDITNVTQEKGAEKPKYNLRHTKINDKKNVSKSIETKESSIEKSTKKKNIYEKSDKSKTHDNSESSFDRKVNTTDEILMESKANCESKKPRRTLRLRRRKVQDNEEEADTKLKDIMNLQKEFSDVTMGVPAPEKHVKDIESPEKNGEEENLPPLLGAQSCPLKSVQRSRRKLFTPRAEPLEESLARSGDSPDRVRVPRPAYHRTRARRKL